jgi:hypothetical protein
MLRTAKLALALVTLVLAGTGTANAYIDPNSGGLLFQVLTPIMAVIGATFAFAGRQISQAFRFVTSACRNLFDRLFRNSERDFD